MAYLWQRRLQYIRQLRHDDVSGVHTAVHGGASQSPHINGGEHDEKRSNRNKVRIQIHYIICSIWDILLINCYYHSLSQDTNTAPCGYRHMRHYRHGVVVYYLHKFLVHNLSLRIRVFIVRFGEYCAAVVRNKYYHTQQ